MKDVRRFVVVLALMTPWVVSDASAQGSEHQFFVNLDGGYQSGSSTVTDSSSFTLYGEDGSVDVDYDQDRSGGLFNISGGVLLWRNIGFAVGYSRSTTTSLADLTVVTPHPIFFDRPRTSLETVDLSHTSNMVHFMAVAKFPLAEKFELTVSGGPSRLESDQTVVLGAVPVDITPPFDTVDAVVKDIQQVKKIGAGFNVGADLAYMFHPNYGAGFFVRYAGGTLDFPSLETGGVASFDVGGIQFGGGIRLRF